MADTSLLFQAVEGVMGDRDAMREMFAHKKPPPPPGERYAQPHEVIDEWATMGTEARAKVMRQLRTPDDPTGVIGLMKLREKRAKKR